MKIKGSLYFLGLSCFPISIISLVIFYSFYFNYLNNINSYLTVLILSSLIGLIFLKQEKDQENINIYEQILLIFLIYFLISFFLLPFFLSEYNISFIDSYFEAISGLTEQDLLFLTVLRI